MSNWTGIAEFIWGDIGRKDRAGFEEAVYVGGVCDGDWTMVVGPGTETPPKKKDLRPFIYEYWITNERDRHGRIILRPHPDNPT